MDPYIQNVVDAFTNSEQLQEFALSWSLEEEPYIKQRIFQLKCQELFDLIDKDVMIPSPDNMEIENTLPWLDETVTVPSEHVNMLQLPCTSQPETRQNNIEVPLSSHEPSGTRGTYEMSTENYRVSPRLAEACKMTGPSKPKYFRPWEDASPESNMGIPSPQPGPSGLQQTGEGTAYNQDQPYTYRMKRQRVFAKNKATDASYEVKFNDNWKGEKLKELNVQLHKMFDEILDNMRGKPSDLGRVVVQHGGLKNPIVVPLQPWEKLDSQVVLDGITKVLNSNEELIVDDSFSITIGSINIPSGSGGSHLPITSLFGPGNSLRRKRSIFEVISDTLCLPISIGLCYLKTCKKVKMKEWKMLIKNQPNQPILDQAIKYKTCPKSFYDKLLNKSNLQKQKEMAERLCLLANVPKHRSHGLNDITPFEHVLDVNINVISSKLGNKFVRVTDNSDLMNLFVYLVETDNIQHYHGIASITGFFNSSFFCEICMKPFAQRGAHWCETCCKVCTSQDCTTKNPLTCRTCHRECRSQECYERHRTRRESKRGICPSQCETWYRCKTCKKQMKYEERKPEQHQCGEWKCSICERYHVGQHWCYQRATVNNTNEKTFLFYDFETRQDEKMECEEGYFPANNRCDTCEEKLDPCAKCRKCQHCSQARCGLFQHIVNFGILHSACQKCQNQELTADSRCENCGNRCIACSKKDKRKQYVNPPCPITCGRREHVFSGDEAARQFCSHIMQEHYSNSILVAHNAKAFDLYPILEVLIDRHSVRPDKIIYNGTKVMYMYIAKKLNLTFVDSLNFLPMKLANFPKAFGLTEMCKGYFPHHFNRKENQEYVGRYPTPTDYGCDYMDPEDRAKFMTWYFSKAEEIFDFRKEMLNYCRSDVDILRRGCLRFRDVIMELTNGIDPFNSITIAGACMNIFKTLFLKEEHEIEIKDLNTDQTTWLPERYVEGDRQVLYDNHWTSLSNLDKNLIPGGRNFVRSPIGMVPSDGYSKRDNFSQWSIQWLEWIMSQNKQHIKHALNGGEFRIPGTNYRMDGYDEALKTVYEFHGCVYHGCPTCYPRDRTMTTHPTTNQSMEELYTVTKKRETEIKYLGYKCVVIWEHEYQHQLKSNEVMKRFVDSLDIQDRLNPRDSFFGGRTNAVKLHHKVEHEDETIEYYDFTSLYPWTNKYCKYPVGHPKIITDDFRDMSAYFGMAKVKVSAPRGLFHPVLPYTSNGKLKFPLCHTCADNENQNPCTCNEEQRAFIGTWCTPELMKAVQHGYKILKTYEVYHFEESMTYNKTTGVEGLFSKYVNTFLKIKQEASGWPEGCETEDQKLQYIKNYEEKEGILLDYHKIEKNPGLRSVAKICLNSFWGKFGQRLGLKQSRFIHESEADIFFKMISDTTKDIYDFHIVTPEILQLEWSDDPLFLPIDTKTNVFLASFTTCWARLKLYSILEKIGEDCLYMDTDSVIFVDRAHEHTKRLPIGNYLGELTNEISSKQKHIVEYVSGGPKNYAFRTCDGSETCKVRGFTLNFANSKLINFDAIKNLVIHPKKNPVKRIKGGKRKAGGQIVPSNQEEQMEDDHIINVTNPNKITRDPRKRILYNRKEDKHYQIVYTKRVVLPDLRTVPYGY